MNKLSLGKIRGLQQVANEAGVITMVAFDHRDSFVEVLRQTLKVEPLPWETVAAEKVRIARALAPFASSVLLDPLYGAGPVIASQVLPGKVAFAVAREESGYGSRAEGRVTRLLVDWDVAAIKRLGGAVVKLLLYYHPTAANAGEQEAVVSRVAAECEAADIPLMLEPISYPLEAAQKKTDPAFAAERPELVLESARRLAPLGVDILKAEFPTEARHEKDETKMYDYCRQLSEIAAANGIPWVLLSAGVDFSTFQRQVEIACEAGASGFVAGRAIWKEAAEIADEAGRDRFLNTIGVSRVKVLGDIATYRATPWTVRAANRLPELGEGWHEVYHRAA
jgi:tagatose 1,6-diphosphate aldolase